MSGQWAELSLHVIAQKTACQMFEATTKEKQWTKLLFFSFEHWFFPLNIYFANVSKCEFHVDYFTFTNELLKKSLIFLSRLIYENFRVKHKKDSRK